jgi:hypothetical protein
VLLGEHFVNPIAADVDGSVRQPSSHLVAVLSALPHFVDKSTICFYSFYLEGESDVTVFWNSPLRPL